MKVFSIVLVSFLCGCATIIQPGPDKIDVSSEPEGARVYLNGNPVGHTPMKLSVNRSDDMELKLQKDGYETITANKDKVVAGWVFLDVLFWPSFIVDLVTHNQGKHPEAPLHYELVKTAGDSAKTDK